MSTSLPSLRPRRTFPGIAPVSWEHPADRAALQSLRTLPGFEDVVKKIIAMLGGERGIRLLFQANAVRVGPTQFPKLWTAHVEMCTTFDWPKVPELYVSQTPVFNAGAYGVDEPFIVLHTAALELLDEDEIRVLLAHELGHVVSGHSLYRTIAAILLAVSLGALPFLAGVALWPIRLAVLEWSRKSELSSDRAGLLGGQDPIKAQQLFMKMAGGTRLGEYSGQLDVDSFMVQANEYLGSNEGLDVVYKILHTLALTHPMHTVRAAELQQWVSGGDYDRILRGEYVRRGSEAQDRPLKDDLSAAGAHYAREARETVGHVVNAAKRAAEKAGEAFRNAQTEGFVRLLIIGGGGREHALAWSLRREDPNANIYCAPGNPGTATLATNLDIPATDLDRIADAADAYGIDLVVVGPEVPLALGLADRLRAEGRLVVGPGAAGAQIEASKAFSKELMVRAGVPTAASHTFTDLGQALAYVAVHPEPLVVKASGLAAGKGAVVCATRAEAAATVTEMLGEGKFGECRATSS